MSIPGYSIKCEKCDYVADDGIRPTSYFYRNEQGEFPLKHYYGWCFGCGKHRHIEDISKAALHEAIDQVVGSRQTLEKYNCGVVSKLLKAALPSRRRLVEREQEVLDGNLQYIYLAALRKGKERCLTCGSNDVKPYRTNIITRGLKLEDDFVFSGRDITDYCHPGCGGLFHHVGTETRFLWKTQAIFYTPEGEFIESFDTRKIGSREPIDRK